MNLGPEEKYNPNNPDHQDPTKYEVVSYGSTGRYPTSVSFDVSLREDMARRDFTFNAMAIDKDGNILDFFGGIDAIHSKMVKTVGDAQERFDEDYLRILRAIRFAGRLGFDLDMNTIKAIVNNRWKLMSLSPERIKDELWKMAGQTGDRFVRSLRLMDSLGVLEVILPEVWEMTKCKETQRHHPEAYLQGDGSVFSHTLAAIRMSKSTNPVVNMSILFHDIGKPVCHVQDGDRHTYFGHGDEAKPIIEEFAVRFKLSKREKSAILFAAINHMKMWGGDKMKPIKVVNLVASEHWGLLKHVSLCDDSCRGEIFHRDAFDDTINNMEEVGRRWTERDSRKRTKVFDGNRVLQLTGLKPSKLVGDIVRAVTEDVINNNVELDEDIDELIMKHHKELK